MPDSPIIRVSSDFKTKLEEIKAKYKVTSAEATKMILGVLKSNNY
jgi:hypothetical protein